MIEHIILWISGVSIDAKDLHKPCIVNAPRLGPNKTQQP